MNEPTPAAPKKSAPLAARYTWGILILAVLFVMMPFLFWQATTFSRHMTDSEIARALQPFARPRDTQHALAQIEPLMRLSDPSVRRWYPQVLALASSPYEQIRLTVAWTMGQDNQSQEFHAALLNLLNDPQPMVQRNAALALVRFQDDSGHAAILTMLAPYLMQAPFSGVLETRLKPGDVVNPGTMVAKIQKGSQSGNMNQEVRTSIPGTIEMWTVPQGSAVTASQVILRISPSEDMVWEALRALVLVGRESDLPAIEPYASGAVGVSPRIREQAQLTVRTIYARYASPATPPVPSGSPD
jgi:hypothetical protein